MIQLELEMFMMLNSPCELAVPTAYYLFLILSQRWEKYSDLVLE